MADQYHHGNLKSKLLEEAVTLISQDGLEIFLSGGWQRSAA